MDNKMNLKAKTIAEYLKKDFFGKDVSIMGVCSIDNIKPHCLLFSENATPEVWSRLSNLQDNIVICDEGMGESISGPRIISNHPRLSFVVAATHYFIVKGNNEIHPSAIIHEKAKIGNNVHIGAFSYIDENVSIGNNTIISENVIIKGTTKIGENCFFKSNSVIGEDGFGFVLDEKETPIRTPHFGGIFIGDNVWVGANTTIERGIFDETILESHVKIDDLVQIGHNSIIGYGTRITAGTIICGGVNIKPQCWVAPNSNILERKVIGRGSYIGIGTNVLSDVPENSVFVGNPGKKLRENE